MPTFQTKITLPRPVPEVFDFFCDPYNLEKVSPPELHMKLVEGPRRLELGSRLVVQGRRWGVAQRVVSLVTCFEPNVRFTDEVQEGPFRKFIHVHRFDAVSQGTRVIDRIDFEPPGGLLGLMVTAAFIERNLNWIFAFRLKKLIELFGTV
jgi:ligand-binding SRPBCC domain-containing protein